MATNWDDFDLEAPPPAPKAEKSADTDWSQFELAPPAPSGGFVASAKQSVGSLIKGTGQAAADFIPGVGQDNAVKQYGQSVIDANPTAVHSLGDIADKPGMAVREAAGNATGSIGGMVGARVLGNAITAAAPLTGPLAPATAAVGQGVAWLGPWAAAALPSFGGIREQQIKDDPTRQDSVGSKALAAAGAGTVGLIENKFGPQEWALKALTKEGRAKLAEKFAANSVAGSIGKGVARGAAVEGAEELAQNPVEQLAAYQDPTTAENVQDTLFGGAMGFLGGGVFGGGVGAASRVMGGENSKAAPPADPADTEDSPTLALPAPTYTGTPNDQVLQAEAERANAVAEAEARAAGIYQQRADFEAAQQGQPEQPPVNAGLELVRQAYAAQLDALQQQEQGQPPVPQSAPPDGRAALEMQAAQAQAQREADRAVMGPDDEILQSTGAAEPPHRAMGIDPAAGPLSAGAAIAVDTGVAGQMAAAAQAVTAQDAAQQQAAGPLAGSPLDAGARFVAGEKWSKPGRSGYVIDRVSDDGKTAIARDGNDTFTIGLDVETANGWKPEGRDLGAARQDPAAAWNSMSMPERAAVAGRVGLPPVVANNIPRTGWDGLNSDLQARISKAMAPAAPATAPSIEGADLGNGWAKFSAESGTAGVPRAEMPQIKAEHRGAMVNFMNARGVAHQEETLPASSLKPTQAEFSRDKVARAAGFEGGNRAILVSADNHILDGHHQWMAARDKGEDVRAIRLNAPIRDLIGLAHDFPSSTKAGGAAGPAESTGTRGRAADAAEDLRAMAQDAGWAERGGLLLRDASGSATGRTKWLPRAEWFMAGMEADPETLARDIDRFAAGERVPAKSLRTIEGMLDWLDAQRGAPRLDEDASAYDFEAAGIDLDASEEAMLIGDIFAEAAPQDEAAVMRALGFTEEEIQDVVGQEADRKGPRSAGQDGAGRAQEAGEVARTDAQPQGKAGSEGSPEGLTSYTNEDIARQEVAQRTAATEAERAQREADQKAQADAERGSFTLTGSDRAADVLAAQGQGGLFDAPAASAPDPKPQAAPVKADPGARWDSLTSDQRAEILTQPSGWSTSAGGLNVIGKQLAGKGWAQIPEGTRGTIARLMEKAVDQVPVKNETPVNTGDLADSDASNQEPIKNEASANAGTAADKIGAFDIEIPAKAQQLLADAEERDIVTAQSVRQMFDGKEGMFDGGLHTPSEADVTAQMKALSVARMGVAAEAKAIGKYEAETAQLIEQAIQYSAVGRTLTKIGARKDVQAPAGVVTAGAQYTKSGGEFSGSAAAKLREARESAAFLEALRRRNLSRHGKVSTKSVTDRLGFAARPADPPAVGISPDPLEALFSDLTSNSTRKANKARKAAAKLPEAARIEYVQANFHDILMQMMEAGALEVNGATTLTEDNAPCL